MFIEAKKLIGLPVAAMDTESKVGVISKIIIDPKNGNLMGFLLKKENILSSSLALANSDISEWDPNGLLTPTIDNLVKPEEIIRLNEILQNNFDLFGLKAKTQSGKKLGQVDNFLIDSETSYVMKYYLKDLILGDRVFSSDKVVKIDKVIVFTDDVEQIPTSAEGATA